MLESSTIGIIGGTGKLGSALAGRWAAAGLSLVIGSRDAGAAAALAEEIGCRGATNADAAAMSDIVVVTVPFGAQAETLSAIAPHVAGKTIVDTTVPLMPPKVMRVQLPPEGSAAVRAQALLPAATVISTFHNVAAHKLAADADVGCDVLVFGDERVARDTGVALASAARLRGIHGGPLVNSAAAEAMTSLLIFINKLYQVDGAGIAITGVLVEPD